MKYAIIMLCFVYLLVLDDSYGLLTHMLQWSTAIGQQTNLKNPTVYLSHIPQYTIQNRNVHISVLNDV